MICFEVFALLVKRIQALLQLLLVVYVDGFKMAGPKKNTAQGWKIIKKGLKVEDPKPIDKNGVLYLGCKQSIEMIDLPNNTKVTAMTYDMENFLESRVSSYLELGCLRTGSETFLLHSYLKIIENPLQVLRRRGTLRCHARGANILSRVSATHAKTSW